MTGYQDDRDYPYESEEPSIASRTAAPLGEGMIARSRSGWQSPPGRRGRNRKVVAMSVLASGGLLAGIAWFFLHGGEGSGGFDGDEPPLIQADRSPVKQRPEQPGGLEVPHQDKLVFERLNPAAQPQTRVERLLPPPEAPLPRPEPPPVVAKPPTPSAVAQGPAQGPDAQPPGQGQGTMSDGAAMAPAARVPQEGAADPSPASAPPMPPPAPSPKPPAPPAPAPVASVPPAAQQAPAAKPAGVPVVAAAPKPAAPPAVAAPPVPTPLRTAPLSTAPLSTASTLAVPPAPAVATGMAGAAGGFRVQLASLRSEDEAQAEWKRLQSRFPGPLSGLGLVVKRVDLGERGIYYRVQGGVVDEARARNICNELKNQNAGCQIVRP